MPEDNNNDSALFSGSVDRSKLEEMKAAAGDDPVRQAQVAEVQAQVDAVAESDEAAEKAREDALAAQQPQAQPAGQPAAEPTTTEAAPAPAGAEAPPRAGAGSGRDAWADYAESRGVAVTDDMTRDEIIEACEG